MGATGKSTSSYYDFKDNPILSGNSAYMDGTAEQATEWWKEHDDISNFGSWVDGLSKEENSALKSWADIGYSLLSNLYGTEWDKLDPYTKSLATRVYDALNKFELKKGITVDRATNFRIFGNTGMMTEDQVRDFIANKTDGGLIQSDGFMSFSTVTNGYQVAGKGLVIHLNVPPSKGAGAYIGNVNPYEKEYLLNNNSILKFDKNSVRTVAGPNGAKRIHVNATVVGRADMQTIDKKNNSQFKK